MVWPYRKASFKAPAVGLLIACIFLSSQPLADGFHITDFEKIPVRLAWQRYKKLNTFPVLRNGQTWSDLIELGEVDRKLTQDTRISVDAPPKEILAVATLKLIAVLKYCGSTYFVNASPDPPLWYYTKEGRQTTLKHAKEILAEIGWQTAPYLFEALEKDIRFTTGADREEIFKLQDALREVEVCGEALDELMRKKVPQFRDGENDLRVMMQRFLDENNLADKKDSIICAREFIDRAARLTQLVNEFADLDNEIKKLRGKRKDAERHAQNQAKKVTPAYGREYFPDARVADDYVQNLKDAIVACGPKALPFLDKQAHLGIRVVARAAKDLAFLIRAAPAQQQPVVQRVPDERILPPLAAFQPEALRVKDAAARLNARNDEVARLEQALAQKTRLTSELKQRLDQAKIEANDDPLQDSRVTTLNKHLAQATAQEYAAKLELDEARKKKDMAVVDFAKAMLPDPKIP